MRVLRNLHCRDSKVAYLSTEGCAFHIVTGSRILRYICTLSCSRRPQAGVATSLGTEKVREPVPQGNAIPTCARNQEPDSSEIASGCKRELRQGTAGRATWNMDRVILVVFSQRLSSHKRQMCLAVPGREGSIQQRGVPARKDMAAGC